MISTDSKKREGTAPGPCADAGPCDGPPVWGALERFLRGPRDGGRGAAPPCEFLRAVRDGTDADVAAMYPDAAGSRDVTVVGEHPAPPGGYLRFIQDLLAEVPPGEDHLVRTRRGPPTGGPPAHPRSVVLVRAGEAAPTWIAALSHRPGRPFGPQDVAFIRSLGLARDRQVEHIRSSRELKDALFGLVHCLTAAIDAKDPYTCGHSERVARIAVRLGRQMGLPAEALSDLHIAGLLHDIGKIGIRDEVLLKPDKLTPEEFRHIQEHPVIGERIIARIRQFARLRPGVRHHHERPDGHGYPDGLKGEAIPLAARILAVADSCDAMLSTRRYRAALSPERVEAILSEYAGAQWDPAVVAHFMACRQDIYPIVQHGLGQSVLAAVEQILGRAGG